MNDLEKNLMKIELDEYKKLYKTMRESIEYAIAQKDQWYGMSKSEAIKFRERKVFSILEECLEEIDE